MDNSARKNLPVLDRVAVLLSGICLLHCLALPFLLLALPVLNELASDHLHAQMLLVAIPISVIALALGFRRHENPYVIAFGTLGMALLVIGGTVVHSRYGLAADRTFSVSGALVLAVTHYFNSRLAHYSSCRGGISHDACS
ncbi:MAG: MerC domain-containing protein [Woeseia sp.]